MEGKGGIHVRQMAGQEHMGLEQRVRYIWRGAWSMCEVRDVPHIPVHAHSFRPHLLVLQLFTVHEGQVQEIAQRVGQLSSGARHLRADKPYMR